METILTADQMREADSRTIDGLLKGNGLLLMEHAGTACVRRLFEKFEHELPTMSVAVLAGTGNNGGDGMVIARQLASRQVPVTVFLCGNPDRLSPDANHQLQALHHYPVDIQVLAESPGTEFSEQLTGFPIIVDAMLGTGIQSEPRGVVGAVVELLNGVDVRFILAVDVPTGLHTDRSVPPGISVRADETVTFGRRKPCHLLYPAAARCGSVILDKITIPDSVVVGIGPDIFAATDTDIRDWLPVVSPDSHKGTFGHVGIVGGRRGRLGASILAGRAALRTGSGLVTIKLDNSRYDAVASLAPELMFDLAEPALDRDVLDRFAEDKQVVLAGPGFGTDPEAKQALIGLVDATGMPLVLDADVFHLLNLTELADCLNGRTVVLTPHPGEMAALMNLTVPEVQADRLGVAREVARRTNAITVLKGAGTVVAEPDGRAWINTTGNPGMGTAGSGDVLGGMIASLIGQGMEPARAAVSGVFLHGRAGDLMSGIRTQRGLTAPDMIAGIPMALSSLSESA